MDTSTDPLLSTEEQRLLLRIARDSIERYAHDQRRITITDYPLTPMLYEKCGAFVTLRTSGALRGCIGYTKSTMPIAQTVAENAVNAGFSDPRFPPVTAEEVPEIDIEVSVLLPGEEEGSPFIKVTDISEIKIGQDGLYLEHAGARGAGLLLPQVPEEQGWDLDAYLSGICMKAGAPDGAWQYPTSQLYRFRAQVFDELTMDN